MKTQPQAPLDKFVLGVLEGFYIYVISRRLAEILINFKKANGYRAEVLLKTRVQYFIVFKGPPDSH